MAERVKPSVGIYIGRVSQGDATIEDAIGERLRLAFQPSLAEPIPQRFVDLIRRLELRDSDETEQLDAK